MNITNLAPCECLICKYQSKTRINGDCLLCEGGDEEFRARAPKNCPYLKILDEMEMIDLWE